MNTCGWKMLAGCNGMAATGSALTAALWKAILEENGLCDVTMVTAPGL